MIGRDNMSDEIPVADAIEQDEETVPEPTPDPTKDNPRFLTVPDPET